MFKHVDGNIVLDDGSERFICSLAEFTDSSVRPSYQGIPEGMVVMCYDPGGEGIYQSDGKKQMAIDDSINQTTLAGYAEDRAEIQAAVIVLRKTPTDLEVIPSSVDEGEPTGTTVGEFFPTYEIYDAPYSYALVSGTGDDDNSSFQIDGDQLQTNAVFDYETKNTYSIRVEVTTNLGYTFAKALTITVNDVAE